MEKQRITDLAEAVRKLMIHCGYSERGITCNIRIWNTFKKYAKKTGTEFFTEELGDRYLKEKYGYPYPHRGDMPSQI